MPKPEQALAPPSPAALHALAAAKALAAAGDLDQARQRALPVLGEPALHVAALLVLHDLARRRGDAAEALRLAGRAARLAPKSPRAQSLFAMTQTEAGRHEAAMATARHTLTLDPNEPLAMAALFAAAERLGRPQAVRDVAVAALAAPVPSPELAPMAARLLAALSPDGSFGVLRSADGGEIAGVVAPGPGQVDLLADGKRLVRVAADQSFLAETGLAAFRYAPRKPLAPGTTVEAVLAATGRALLGSPQIVATARAPSPGPVRGAVRALPDGRIVGHLYDPARPTARLRLALVPDGDPAGTVFATADAFDADLLARGFGDGRHAFAVAWPHEPGLPCRRVRILAADTGEPLAGSPVTVPQPREAAAALSRLNAWLREAGRTPDAPPPLPEACRGALLDLARSALAALAGECEAAPGEPETPGDAHA
ncbi:hypothetical protein [Solidesulfovibrio sp.]|uniref:hypothetical protein n=1 Tax=Solidesulfovibrio sp. TaxID=2910990 RepID=UPI0026274362|nr:hypothetical protein [Solidesulfovibrio sp.]